MLVYDPRVWLITNDFYYLSHAVEWNPARASCADSVALQTTFHDLGSSVAVEPSALTSRASMSTRDNCSRWPESPAALFFATWSEWDNKNKQFEKYTFWFRLLRKILQLNLNLGKAQEHYIKCPDVCYFVYIKTLGKSMQTQRGPSRFRAFTAHTGVRYAFKLQIDMWGF